MKEQEAAILKLGSLYSRHGKADGELNITFSQSFFKFFPALHYHHDPWCEAIGFVKDSEKFNTSQIARIWNAMYKVLIDS